ncbi:phage/plasmid primase, P4 family [Sulfurimonas sp.]|jgi:putative DNA primase/helicase|uniref:DNA primase family protein n=1 Tax=Sulfurimonas sp. TaxID=2022749 RepID=UPI0025CD3A2B|nr:DNA primase family protein [Sulfurimonas sp.]MBT5934391.1 DNA primase [Sulfurimonas sp.]
MGLGLKVEDIQGAKEKLALGGNEIPVVGTIENISNENYTITQENRPANNMLLGKKFNKVTNPLELIAYMLDSLSEVDLIATLTEKIGDDLNKYQKKVVDENGVETSVIDPLKVPRNLYIVAVIEELRIAGEKFGWSLAQQDNMLYLYNGTYWVRIEDSVMKNFIAKAAIKMGYYSPADAMTSGFEVAAFKQFLTSSYLPSPEVDKSKVLINLLNGTYEVTENGGVLREHRKEDFITYCLGFEYDPTATAPLFTRYLNRVLPDTSSQIVLQEFHGYIFTKNLKLEKAMVLKGNGQNGKSVQYEITSAMLGEHNIATKSLGDLVNNDSGNDSRAKLKDKLVNYGSEISAANMEIDIFKRLVSGEPVAAREKYKTSFDLRNNCKFIFNANKLPSNVENTEAYFRRFLIVPYDETITEDEKDPELHIKIIANELPGVLNWAIEGLNRILKNKKFSECAASEEALDTYKKESNSVAMMIEDECFVDGRKYDKDYRIPNKAIYNIYREYCAGSGMRALNKINFSKELKHLGFEQYRSGGERGFLIAKVTQ